MRIPRALLFVVLVFAMPFASLAQDQTGDQTPQSIFRQAYALTPQARTVADFDRIITICEQGLNDDTAADKEYGKTLAAWAYNKRGELHAAVPDGAEAALADFSKSVELDPNNWRSLHNQSVSLGADGQFEAAAAAVNRVIELQPQFANAHFNRGELAFAMGQMETAVESFTRAVELGQTDAEVFANRGDAFTALARLGEALRDYQNAIRLQSDLARAYQSAAWILASADDANLRDAPQALNLARRGSELEPENHRAVDILAFCQAANRQFAAAVESQRRAMELAEAAGVADEALVGYRERLGQYQERVDGGGG